MYANFLRNGHSHKEVTILFFGGFSTREADRKSSVFLWFFGEFAGTRKSINGYFNWMMNQILTNEKLGGGFKDVFIFHPYLGKISIFDSYFFKGVSCFFCPTISIH